MLSARVVFACVEFGERVIVVDVVPPFVRVRRKHTHTQMRFVEWN